jgi:hypothetical protein
LHALKVEQLKLAGMIYNKVMEGMTDYFEAWRIGGGGMTEAWMKDMLSSVCQAHVEHLAQCFQVKLKTLADYFESYATNNGRPPQMTTTTPYQRTRETYALQTNHHGELSRLPNNLQFPKGGMHDCWVQWNVGHVEHLMPALRSITPREFQFIDDIAKTDSEKWKRSQRGPHQYKYMWRPSWKTYCDMKLVCNYIQSKASKVGADTTDRSLDNIRKMFDAASKELMIRGAGDRNQRIDQFKWRMMVFRIQKKLKAQWQGAG